MKEYAVYTAIFGPYDVLKEPPVDPACDYFCFTDQRDLSSSVYTIRLVSRQFEQPVREARYYKILSHKICPSHPKTLWVDGSVTFKFDRIASFIDAALRSAPIAMHQHPANDDIYCELERCLALQKDDPVTMRSQVERYRSEGYPAASGLVSSGVIVRASQNSAVQTLENAWWNEVEHGSIRDQLSFNYCCWRLGLSWESLGAMRYIPQSDPEFESDHFKFWLHGGTPKRRM